MDEEFSAGYADIDPKSRGVNVKDIVTSLMAMGGPAALLRAPKMGIATINDIQKQKLLAAALRESKVWKP